MQTNVDIFKAELIKQYHNLKDDPEYFAVFSKMTPEELAEKMMPALIRGSASKDGKGINRTCKALGDKKRAAKLAIADLIEKHVDYVRNVLDNAPKLESKS